ncbi:hypothetical protein [Terrimonas ferruginea]|uniref:hypothetical protein n=1 Tax=Terrimonas ferruginea TaxID=249 RepID=UPI001FE0A5F7|nr:hypothetical protein [Terrimonas ferruginea]
MSRQCGGEGERKNVAQVQEAAGCGRDAGAGEVVLYGGWKCQDAKIGKEEMGK